MFVDKPRSISTVLLPLLPLSIFWALLLRMNKQRCFDREIPGSTTQHNYSTTAPSAPPILFLTMALWVASNIWVQSRISSTVDNISGLWSHLWLLDFDFESDWGSNGRNKQIFGLWDCRMILWSPTITSYYLVSDGLAENSIRLRSQQSSHRYIIYKCTKYSNNCIRRKCAIF